MGYVCCTYEERKGITGFCWGNVRERIYLEGTGVDGKIILRWIFRNWYVGLWSGSSRLRIGKVGGNL